MAAKVMMHNFSLSCWAGPGPAQQRFHCSRPLPSCPTAFPLLLKRLGDLLSRRPSWPALSGCGWTHSGQEPIGLPLTLWPAPHSLVHTEDTSSTDVQTSGFPKQEMQTAAARKVGS